MTDSLLIAGLEMIGAAVNPEYRLARDEFTLGDPEPDTATIASLLLDGDVVSGLRTRNRQVGPLGFWVNTSSRSDLSVKMNTIRQAVDAETFTVQWTPDGGLPVVFDAYRATVTRNRSIIRDNQLWAHHSLTFQASPFGRSPTAVTISGSSSTQLDSFDTAPTGATLDTSSKFEGTGSAQFTLTSDGGSHYLTGTAVSRSFTAVDIHTDAYLTLRLLTSIGITTTVTLTLLSAGKSSTFVASSSTHPVGWQLATFNLSNPTATTGGGVDLTAVTGYSLTVSATQGHANLFSAVTAHIDDLRAVGGTATLLSTTNGEVILLPAVLGSARTPVSLAVTGTSMAGVLLHSPPVDQDSNAQILMGVSVGVATANTTVTVGTASSGYKGTYSLILGRSVAAAPSGNDTVQVIVTQLENGVSVATKTIEATYTAAALATGTLVPVGDVTLPLRATADDNTATSYTFEVNHTFGMDQYTDLMLCDVRGQTVIAVPPATVPAIYVDAPDVSQGIGPVMASAAGRSQAYGIFDGVLAVGGPILFEPGTNKVLAWCQSGAPTVAATYFPRWLDERVV